MAVLVLQTLAGERGASSGSTHEEAFAAGVGEGPDKVADALKSEHRIIGEKRNHRDAVGGVGCAGGSERCHGAGFRDPFFENLPVLSFLVEQKDVTVDRFVEL